MIWLVRRRLRVPLGVAIGLAALVAVAAVVGRIGWLAATRSAGFEACLGGSYAGVCGTPVWYEFRYGYDAFRAVLAYAAIALPGVAGAIVGAALFAPETARGTHVFALTQAVPRVRWWGAGLLIAGAPVAAAIALVPPVLAWAASPFDDQYLTSSLSPSTFLTSGVVPVAYAVLAFCVGATAGMLLRSTIGAIGLAVGLHLVLLLLLTALARPAYLPPETLRIPLPPPGQSDIDWFGTDGLTVDNGYLDVAGNRVQAEDAPLLGCDGATTFTDCLRTSGFTGVYTDYHPPSRYWPFQVIESGLLLALAAAALGAGLWGLRRRVH